VPRTNLWNRLEDLKVPFELRVVALRLYEKLIAKFRNTQGWSEEIDYNIEVKQGFPLSATLFGTYIDKLEDCLEDAGCVGPTLAIIVTILLLYVDIFLILKIPYNIGKKIITLKEFCYNVGMIVNTNQTKVMIIKSKRITYDTFFMTKIAWRKFLNTIILELISTISSIVTMALKNG